MISDIYAMMPVKLTRLFTTAAKKLVKLAWRMTLQ